VNVFFDVDFTLIDSDGRLRPGVGECFATLRGEGHRIFLWSGLGPRWEVVRQHGLETWVEDCFVKPLYHHRRMLEPLGISIEPHFVVDDHPHLVDVFGGCVVGTYMRADPADREMWRVQEAVASAALNQRPRRAPVRRTGSID
jgi:hypothetical protein